MRDKLIELIKEAKKHTKGANCDIEREMLFVDYLLANGVIVPPCKQRDTIYDISEFLDDTPYPEIYEIYVDCITLESDETEKIIFCIDGFEYYYDDFGKTVFLTQEEAEKALKGDTE